MTELISIPDHVTEFTANGETYYIEEKLSIARYQQFLKFQREIVTGLTHFDLIQLLKNNVANLNDVMAGGKVLAQMSYENINALNNAGNLEKKEPFEVWISTLVMNTKDEDRRVFDIPTMQAKIKNWMEAGIEIGFFTSKAEALCGLPAGALRSHILTYSDLRTDLNLTDEDTSEYVDPTSQSDT